MRDPATVPISRVNRPPPAQARRGDVWCGGDPPQTGLGRITTRTGECNCPIRAVRGPKPVWGRREQGMGGGVSWGGARLFVRGGWLGVVGLGGVRVDRTCGLGG
ncbi:hypothetical protein GCM10009804_23470 [Kribbella hippodromi]|uniref:Uncharacterized protein n=1 Tax=Kribbella hippodromi TaxID=434347 RepID=A0ABP4NQR5_9ACTN